MTRRAKEIVREYLTQQLKNATTDEEKYKVYLDATECEEWDMAEEIEKSIADIFNK